MFILRYYHARDGHVLLWPFLLFLLSSDTTLAQQTNFGDPATLHAIEAEILAEINFLRSKPGDYAEQVLTPLKATLKRRPKDADMPAEAGRVLLSEHRIDYIEIPEGETIDDARAVIDEAIEALKATPPLTELVRNDVLDQSARWFSTDFLQGGLKREPHVDSLGRKPAERISAFGATAESLADWTRFLARAESLDAAANKPIKIFAFKEQDNYFWVDLPKRGGYRYRYVQPAFGKFMEEHGTELTIPQLGKPGYELQVTIDPSTRKLKYGDARIAYPMDLPAHGENVVWGPWSRAFAARGLVCWWVLDPGLPDRGHRQTLLEPSLRYCGIGCTWSRQLGFVATFDAATEKLVVHDDGETSNGM